MRLFFCLKIYTPDKLAFGLTENQIDEGCIQTDLCPCGTDAVIGSKSGYPITETFLADMHNRWFSLE